MTSPFRVRGKKSLKINLYPIPKGSVDF